MKKAISLMLALILCLSLVACGAAEEAAPVETTPSIEDVYAQLVDLAKNGQYLEGWRLTQANREVLEYEDGQAYHDYCQAMRAYNAGALGEAYTILMTIPQILDAQETIDALAERLGGLNGYYVADNGNGAYLHMVIRDGRVATKVIGYYDEEQTFAYTDEDFRGTLIASTFTDGTEFIATGRYSSIGEKITIEYVLFTFDDTSDLMVVKHEDYEYDTFNGLYTKVAELETA